MTDSSQLAVVGAVFVAVLLVGAWLETKYRKWKGARNASKLAKRGLKAEKEAEKVLKKLGYTLVQRQPPASYWAVVDGEPQNVSLSGDLLVELKGKTYVAEVKTGAASKLEHAETRRQLLEYQLAFGVDGLLLVDMENKKVRTIRFPMFKPPGKSAVRKANNKALRLVSVAAAAGFAVWLMTRSSSPHAGAREEDPSDIVEHEPVLADEPPAGKLGRNPNKLPKRAH